MNRLGFFAFGACTFLAVASVIGIAVVNTKDEMPPGTCSFSRCVVDDHVLHLIKECRAQPSLPECQKAQP